MTADDSGLTGAARSRALLVLYLATAAAVVSSALVNVALPTIAEDLSLSASASTWVVNAYQIGVVAALIPMATAGEVFGVRRVYRIGLAVLVASTLAAALVQDFLLLCLLRGVQGVGAAAVMALNGALLRRIYPHAALGRGVSYNAILIAVVGAASPSVAGVVLALWSWHALFLIMAAIGLAALAAGGRALPATRTEGARLGLFDAGLNAVTFGALFLAISNAGHQELGLALAAQLVLGLGAGAWLWRRSRAAARPFLPVDLLAAPRLRLSYATSFCCFCGQGMALVSLPFFIQATLGFSPLETGALLSLWPIAITIAAFSAGRLVERVSPLKVGTTGLSLFAAGLLTTPLAALPVLQSMGIHTIVLAAGLVLCGAGFGLFQTPNNRTMLATAPPDRIAAAAGMIAQVRLVGQGAGAAMAGAVFAAAGVLSPAPYLIAAGLALLGVALNLRRLWERYGPPAIAKREDPS